MKVLNIIFIFLFFACTSDEGTVYTKFDITSRIFAQDKTARIVVDEPVIPVNCSLYGQGCMNVYRGLVLDYEVFFVEFDTEKHAYFEAKNKKTLYTGNWLIDNIKEEQVLINFFKKHLGAKTATD